MARCTRKPSMPEPDANDTDNKPEVEDNDNHKKPEVSNNANGNKPEVADSDNDNPGSSRPNWVYFGTGPAASTPKEV